MEMITFADMKIKQWTPEEVRELVDLAKSKGIRQEELAKLYCGQTLQALQNWLHGREGRKPSGGSRRALTFAEMCLMLDIVPEDLEGKE